MLHHVLLKNNSTFSKFTLTIPLQEEDDLIGMKAKKDKLIELKDDMIN